MAGHRQWRKFTGTACTAAVLFLALWLTVEPCAAAGSSLEYDVKAAFLLNFTKFTEWPATAFANPQSPLTICLFGNDPFGQGLDNVVQGEVVNGRPLMVRRISQTPAPQMCQVVFIDPAVKDAQEILERLPHGILTVGEGARFLQEGGMIALVIDNRRVRFDINRTAAEHAELKLSSKLLSVARSVDGH